MGAKKGRCAAVIAAVLLMASCISPPSCGGPSKTMAGRYQFDSFVARARSGVRETPIDVYRDQLPPVGLEFRIRSLNRGLGHHCVAPEF